MSKIILFIASSLDGYIAGKNDDLSWLFTDSDYGFNKFFSNIDTVLTGRKTYEITMQLDSNYFKDKEIIIFTKSKNKFDNVKTISENIPDYVNQLKQKEGKNIFLLGGGEITTLFIENNLLDELFLFVHPILIGEGIPLFLKLSEHKKLELLETQSFPSGLLEIHYKFIK